MHVVQVIKNAQHNRNILKLIKIKCNIFTVHKILFIIAISYIFTIINSVFKKTVYCKSRIPHRPLFNKSRIYKSNSYGFLF